MDREMLMNGEWYFHRDEHIFGVSVRFLCTIKPNDCSFMYVLVAFGLIALSLYSLCSSFSLAPPASVDQSVSHSVCCVTNRIISPANHLHRCCYFSFGVILVILFASLSLSVLVCTVRAFIFTTYAYKHKIYSRTHTQRGREFVYSTNRKTATDKEAHLNLILIIDSKHNRVPKLSISVYGIYNIILIVWF